jgi:D-alanyl-D-alanine carboxypeptidase
MTLDDTVARWLPGLLPYGNQINVRELLDMTSGMIDTNDFYARPRYYIDKIQNPTLREQLINLARLNKAHPGYPVPTMIWIKAAAAERLLYMPDTTWHYSNIGYMVAGLIAQRVGGADLATLFRELIIDPLHLTSARYDPGAPITGPHAHSYVAFPNFPNGKLRDASNWTGGEAANGGIVSDAADEAHFLQALMRGQILKPAQLAALRNAWSGNTSVTYGLGVVLQLDGCSTAYRVYGHNGEGNGWVSSVQVSSNGNRVAVVLINGYGASTADQDHASALVMSTMQNLYCSAP